jgi:hypothetical protein
MSDLRETTRAELLARTPDQYLADGFLDADGQARRALLSGDATAAATQLAAAEASPQELAFTYEAIRALLPLHAGDARARLDAALAEALATVARMIRQPNNEGLITWARTCAGFVRGDADIAAFLAHMQAVLRLHALIAYAPSPEGPPSEDGSPPDSAASGSA